MITNHNIKIPEKHYIAFQGREKNVPIGFLTPFGTNAAAKKRMATADNWAKPRGGNQTKIDAKIVDNVLMPGFKIAHSVTRYSTSNVVWRILDPRGFELEISSANMSDLIGSTIIEQGEIQERCIWTRQGANNVLLTEDDPEYLQAIENSERIEKKVSLRDIKIGNTVLLSNGTIGQYMGCFHLISLTYGSYYSSGDGYYSSRNREDDPSKVEVSKTPKHFFYLKKSEHAKRSSFFGISSPKISEIIDKTTVLNLKDTEQMINEQLATGETCIESANGTEYRIIGLMARTKEIAGMEIKLVHLVDPKTFVDAKAKVISKSGSYWHGQALIAEHGDHWIDCETGIFKLNPSIPSQNRIDLVRGNRICVKSLMHDLTIIHKENILYGEKPNHSGMLLYTVQEVLITDCKWHLPLLVYISPSTQNKFEMPLP